MADKTYPMTADGKVKLEKELEQLKTVKRPEVIDRIKIARSFGDLSENSEYESAKDEQSSLETRIAQVEQMLRYAEIIDSDSVAKDEVSVGKSVTFVEVGETDEETYQIVGAAEADPMAGKISNESPIGESLIGHKLGETVAVQTPGGDMQVKITAVE
ncbi:transcription elongation factor GreA [Lacticaseibacillus pantheris]|jgi:transcription elongation factor GreA|uniref:Transcription elongation factor GreA n=1 Tax=Lacticaseibacillus pantheris DSM 15945 = JCM 12539 = NBRC 106106 TaxID=1423783 RepID=A0A0R1U075_9LACO|nr:transcription elongation factor GreA [Lacticaseibacillus pantheris]KRL86857.1 transcription elongation factor greA [Lacticaseibacillus pantheris DSM 15945 = JCM 12539 = NBRC 106106]WKF86080.1 transcription elongation factor GreA [Lacticaseibacillus pantheris]